MPRLREVVSAHLATDGLSRERVLAAAVSIRAGESPAARRRAVARAAREVAGYLGNTPAVARASYIDPRVIERYERGMTIARALADLGKDASFGGLATQGEAERAVIRLLSSRR